MNRSKFFFDRSKSILIDDRFSRSIKIDFDRSKIFPIDQNRFGSIDIFFDRSRSILTDRKNRSSIKIDFDRSGKSIIDQNRFWSIGKIDHRSKSIRIDLNRSKFFSWFLFFPVGHIHSAELNGHALADLALLTYLKLLYDPIVRAVLPYLRV
jgi:hypothetical protein